MSSDKMRQEFEAEFLKHPKFEGNAMYCNAMLERGSDGNYRFIVAEGAWWGWQASRESLVIELPDLENSSSYHDGADQRDAKVIECRKAIEAAGLKVKL